MKETKNNNYTVRLLDICKFDEEGENQVNFEQLEFTTTKNNLRPKGDDYGLEPSLENKQEIEVWTTQEERP